MSILSLFRLIFRALFKFTLFGGWPRTFLFGGLIVLFRLRRSAVSVRVRGRAQRSVNIVRVRFRETAPRAGRIVLETVLVPVANFLSVVATEVQHNLSSRELDSQTGAGTSEPLQEGAEAPGVFVRGEKPEGESGTPEIPALTPRTPSKPVLLLAALIASLITTILALAHQTSKFVHAVFSAITRPQAATLRMDIYDTPSAQTTTLELDAPGATPDAVDLSLYDGWLTIAVTVSSVPSTVVAPATAITATTTIITTTTTTAPGSESVSLGTASDAIPTTTTDATVGATDASSTVADAPQALDPVTGRVYYRHERAHGRLTRTVRVPTGTKAEDLRASVAHGVLTITFPMFSTHQPEKIAVN